MQGCSRFSLGLVVVEEGSTHRVKEGDREAWRRVGAARCLMNDPRSMLTVPQLEAEQGRGKQAAGMEEGVVSRVGTSCPTPRRTVGN